MIETITASVRSEDVVTAKLLRVCGLSKTMSEAKRLVEQNAVEIDGKKVGATCRINDGSILRVGREFRRLYLPDIPKQFTIERTVFEDSEQVKILNIV